MKKNEEKSIKGRFKIECINKHTVQIELDNLSIDFLVETLLELKNEPGVHHFNFDSSTVTNLSRVSSLKLPFK